MEKYLILNFYGLKEEITPTKRQFREWEEENKCGFLLGVMEYGINEHKNEIINGVQKRDAQLLDDLIDKYYDYYIHPFRQHGRSKSNTSSSAVTPSASIEDIPGSEEINKLKITFNRKTFREQVEARDKVCLICWTDEFNQAAHIIARKNVPIEQNIDNILKRANMKNVDQVQNGLWLCGSDHLAFDALQYYIDTFSDENGNLLYEVKSVVKDPKEAEYRLHRIKHNRAFENIRLGRYLHDGLYLYFDLEEKDTYPSVAALNFHKAACLVWRMAGGAVEIESDFLDDSDDDEDIAYKVNSYFLSMEAEEEKATMDEKPSPTEMETPYESSNVQ